MIEVKQEEDGSFTISWDENDPKESMFNSWTKEDFQNAIGQYLKQIGNDTHGKGKDLL
jgi:hypothetical protein